MIGMIEVNYDLQEENSQLGSNQDLTFIWHCLVNSSVQEFIFKNMHFWVTYPLVGIVLALGTQRWAWYGGEEKGTYKSMAKQADKGFDTVIRKILQEHRRETGVDGVSGKVFSRKHLLFWFLKDSSRQRKPICKTKVCLRAFCSTHSH